jgi:acetoin utilization deacetylase AcuC-like enzyme
MLLAMMTDTVGVCGCKKIFETDTCQSAGYNVNVPFNRQKMDTQDYAAVFHKLLLPMALEYGPELIFVAAGFDATRGDKMGIMRVSTAGYGYFTQLLKLINKKIIMSLEGGYNSKLTAMCVEKCVSVLLGQQVSATTPWIPSPQCLETIKYEFNLYCIFGTNLEQKCGADSYQDWLEVFRRLYRHI